MELPAEICASGSEFVDAEIFDEIMHKCASKICSASNRRSLITIVTN